VTYLLTNDLTQGRIKSTKKKHNNNEGAKKFPSNVALRHIYLSENAEKFFLNGEKYTNKK
jgi:hypothetical protein